MNGEICATGANGATAGTFASACWLRCADGDGAVVACSRLRLRRSVGMAGLAVGTWLLRGGVDCSVLASLGQVRSSVEVDVTELGTLRVKVHEAVMERSCCLLVVAEGTRLLDRHSCPGRICSLKHSSLVLDMLPEVVVGILFGCRTPCCVIVTGEAGKIF